MPLFESYKSFLLLFLFGIYGYRLFEKIQNEFLNVIKNEHALTYLLLHKHLSKRPDTDLFSPTNLWVNSLKLITSSHVKK